MSFYEDKISEIIKAMPTEEQQTYLSAVEASVDLDLDHLAEHREPHEGWDLPHTTIEQPRIARPTDIREKFGFTLKRQRDLYISLTRPMAWKVFKTSMYIKENSFRKKYTSERFEATYGTEPDFLPYAKGRENVMILTVAGWAHFIGVSIQFTIPKGLREQVR